MMISEITGGTRDWEIAVKGTSSIFFMYPIILILDAIAWGCTSLWIVNVLVDGYILFLLYNIAYHCMGGKKWAVLAVIMLSAIFLLFVYGSGHRIAWLALKNPAAAIACFI
jgi:hypothetical protein